MRPFTRKLNNRTFWAAAAVAMLGLCSVTLAPVAEAGIKNTKHNLSATSTQENNAAAGQGEICVFCHTPHGSDKTAGAPLWNKVISATGYTVYNAGNESSSLDGTIDLSVGAVSLACLSCHDGTQAMDTVLNNSGSGWNTSAVDGSGGTMTGLTWEGANQTAGKMTGIANLTKDLSNDHPVAIPYGKYDKSDGSGEQVWDADFNKAQKHATKALWWVDTDGTTSSRSKADLTLFTRGTTPYVECASCHDPHVENSTPFLRKANTESALCLACHNK